MCGDAPLRHCARISFAPVSQEFPDRMFSTMARGESLYERKVERKTSLTYAGDSDRRA
jgi:hypothetical protein